MREQWQNMVISGSQQTWGDGLWLRCLCWILTVVPCIDFFILSLSSVSPGVWAEHRYHHVTRHFLQLFKHSGNRLEVVINAPHHFRRLWIHSVNPCYSFNNHVPNSRHTTGVFYTNAGFLYHMKPMNVMILSSPTKNKKTYSPRWSLDNGKFPSEFVLIPCNHQFYLSDRRLGCCTVLHLLLTACDSTHLCSLATKTSCRPSLNSR